jgi:hypothetical protein
LFFVVLNGFLDAGGGASCGRSGQNRSGLLHLKGRRAPSPSNVQRGCPSATRASTAHGRRGSAINTSQETEATPADCTVKQKMKNGRSLAGMPEAEGRWDDHEVSAAMHPRLKFRPRKCRCRHADQFASSRRVRVFPISCMAQCKWSHCVRLRHIIELGLPPFLYNLAQIIIELEFESVTESNES